MKIDDRVCIRETGYAGVVGEIAGNIVYVDMDNGVEMEMKIDDLVLESEYETEFDTERRVKNEQEDIANSNAQAVLDSLDEKLINIGRLTQETASLAVALLGGAAGEWNTLTAGQKLNFIAVATTIPVASWIEWHQLGKLAKLQLVAFEMFSKQNRD